MPKVAVSSQGKGLDDQVDPRFGRAAYHLIVDADSLAVQVLDNSQTRAMGHGAGIQSAENVANSGAEVVLSGFVGPKAYQALQAAGVKIGQGVEGMSVRQAVEKYLAGDVEINSQPSRPGW
jgi:predicted Fe-Mo cluster-binding NifX family protein